ncbi:zonular occludens toxin domain-containing protein [Vibrio parahaemolyticus]
MAVFMVSGIPGSGKSAWTVGNIVLPTLMKKKRKVITNLSLNVPYLVEIKEIDEELIRIVHSEKGDFSDTFLHVEDYQDDWRNEKGQAPVIIVDEAHFSLNKQRKKSEVLEIEEFFSTHRQAGYDIYLITQDYKRIPKDILGFVDTYYDITKQRQMGKSMYSVYVRDSYRKMIGSKTKPYDKEVFKCYKSHLLSDSNIEEEGNITGIKSIWFSWPFLSLYAMTGLLGYGFTFGGLSLNPFAFLYDDDDDSDLKEGVELDKIEFESVDGSEIIIHEPIKNNAVNPIPVNNVQPVHVEPEKPKEIKYLDQNHPLDNKLFQIRSWVGDVGFVDIYDKTMMKRISTIKTTDLSKMGYKVETYSECAMKLIYENVNFFIDCSDIMVKEDGATNKILNNVPTL